MKKRLLILLCVSLSLGLMVNGKTLNENWNIVAEDIPYEWIMVNPFDTVAEDIPYEWHIVHTPKA